MEDKKNNKKEKPKFFEVLKKTWQNPRGKALIKLSLYGIVFFIFFLLVAISSFLNTNNAPVVEVDPWDKLLENNYEYLYTFDFYDVEHEIIETNIYQGLKLNDYYEEFFEVDKPEITYIKENQEFYIYKDKNKELSLTPPLFYNEYTVKLLDINNLIPLVEKATLIKEQELFDGSVMNVYSLEYKDLLDLIEPDQELTKQEPVRLSVTIKEENIYEVTIDMSRIYSQNLKINFKNIKNTTSKL